MNDDLGNRMKEYELASFFSFTRRLPLIIRIDGKAFHGHKFDVPFDDDLSYMMAKTAQSLCEEIQGAQLAYVQSDEISILLTDDETIKTQPWFGKKVHKIISVSASMATYQFNKLTQNAVSVDKEQWGRFDTRYLFDSRAFVLPHAEVANYFVWRQQDATRNSIHMAGRSVFSHKELMNKTSNQIQEMLFKEGINWNDYDTRFKRGLCIVKTCTEMANVGTPDERPVWEYKIDLEAPIFTQERNYIEQFLTKES